MEPQIDYKHLLPLPPFPWVSQTTRQPCVVVRLNLVSARNPKVSRSRDNVVRGINDGDRTEPLLYISCEAFDHNVYATAEHVTHPAASRIRNELVATRVYYQ